MDWIPVAEGKSGARVWRGSGVHLKQGDPAQIAAEAERLIWLAERGIACPAVVDHEPGVLVTTTLPGHPGSANWPEGDRLRMADELAHALRALHDLPTAGCPFCRRLDVTITAAFRAVAAGTLDRSGAELAGRSKVGMLEDLLGNPPPDEDLVVGHGDPSMSNIFFEDDGSFSGFIDVDRLGVADRYSDLSILTRSMSKAWGTTSVERFLGRYGVPPELLDASKLAFYRLLDEFF